MINRIRKRCFYKCGRIAKQKLTIWIFMLIAHGNAPFVLVVTVAAGVIDNLIDTGIYSS